MALPSYGQDVLQRRMQTLGQQQPQANQFSVPSASDVGGPTSPPNFSQISPSSPNDAQGNREPNRDRLYNDNYVAGPGYNPYEAPNPYGGVAVSPTGAVMGQRAITPAQGQTSSSDAPKKLKGTMNPENDPNMKKQSKKSFNKGFFNIGDSKADNRSEKWLKQDAQLTDQLRQLLASQGDFASQFNENTGNIADMFRRSINDINRNKGVALSDLDNAMGASGMIRSSGYGQEVGNTLADFSRQAFDARMNKTTGMADQMAERQNFRRQLEIAKLQARSDALRRLAAQRMDVGGLIG
jgi:hypothetical protein